MRVRSSATPSVPTVLTLGYLDVDLYTGVVTALAAYAPIPTRKSAPQQPNMITRPIPTATFWIPRFNI